MRQGQIVHTTKETRAKESTRVRTATSSDLAGMLSLSLTRREAMHSDGSAACAALNANANLSDS